MVERRSDEQQDQEQEGVNSSKPPESQLPHSSPSQQQTGEGSRPVVPNDIALTPSCSPCQPENISCSRREYSDKSRCFNPAWYQHYSWLEYSVKLDSAYCFPCRFFVGSSIGRGRPEKAFTVNEFKDWKYASDNKGALLSHQKSYPHKQSAIAWGQFKYTSSSGSASEQLGSNRAELIKKNQHNFQAVSHVLLTRCKQDIAVRGHHESPNSLSIGNFLEIPSLLSRYDPIIAERLTRGPSNALYTSHNIQNEIINIMGTIVKQHICASVEKAKYFSLLVDETKDLGKNEQMSISIRYLDLDKVEIAERFPTFVAAPQLTAEHLSKYIFDTLSLFNITVSSMVSQGYDGAAVMSGCVSGVQQHVREVVPHAVYIHCHAHCLNLVLVDCVKSLPEASEFFSLVQSLYVFLSASKAHSIFSQKQAELHPDKQPRALQSLSDTRRACRYNSLDSVKSYKHLR